ncbi:hypothetical protein [Lapillicoccus jejuensis]|uniref:Excreted virulence factor EspC (Type VII ESX diderm) n=1 Tax=Lapillicoccus jejuensis TaxID=402171 RepID=A0A542DV93_9MICO|nr:hypothetical protein [Lapillicoccus jejuensis]TQJ07017.1 hypothetical protein FB458_0063 [Lapillicoccus jejuensis]
MRDHGGGGLTYEVLVEQLGEAAGDVRAVTQLAQAGEVETMAQGIDLGHSRLTHVLWEFCGRWDRGLSLLVGDSTAMADALESTAQDYAEGEAATAQLYLGAGG